LTIRSWKHLSRKNFYPKYPKAYRGMIIGSLEDVSMSGKATGKNLMPQGNPHKLYATRTQ
jgi:hypothetical protein